MANPEDTADHEHVMVPRMREADRMTWDQCTKCTHRTEEVPAPPEPTDEDRARMRAEHAGARIRDEFDKAAG
jgi:hypothetical protein